MRISRSMDFGFRLQAYESMKVMVSVSVSSADLGVSDEELSQLGDTEYEQHRKDLTALLEEEFTRQLTPMLEDAHRLCDTESAASDTRSYYQGKSA